MTASPYCSDHHLTGLLGHLGGISHKSRSSWALMLPVFEDKRSFMYAFISAHLHLYIMQAHSKPASADDFTWYHSEDNDKPMPRDVSTNTTTRQSSDPGGQSPSTWFFIFLSVVNKCSLNDRHRPCSACWTGRENG
jgi:hypothetical protein